MSDPTVDLPLAERQPPGRRARRRRSTGQRLALAIVAGLAAAAFVLILDGLWAGRTMFRGVADARGALGEGAVAVVTGDPEGSRPHFERAVEAAAATVAATSHPSIELAEQIPWLGDNIKAVEAVALASERSAGAGLAMADAATILGWQDIRIPATEALGAVDLPTLRSATPKLDEVAHDLGIAEAQLSGADTGRLLGPIAAGYRDALDTLRRRYALASETRDLAHLLPGFLGAGGSRTYLLAVQTLGLPQGTGGQVDLVGTLAATRGTLAMDQPLAPAGAAYADANVTPDGPTTAMELLRIAKASGLGELDGVVLVDSVWLQDTLWVSGQVEVPGRRAPLTFDDAGDVLERQVFEGTDPVAAELKRARLAEAILEAYLERRPSTEAFAIGSASSAAQRHFLVYSTKPKQQVILERLGATGAFDANPAPLSVTWRTLVENHAVLFARRTVSQTVSLSADGSARVRTVVELVNRSPEGVPSVLGGLPIPATVPEPGGVNPVGGWAGEVAVTLPRGASRISAETSVPSETEVVREQGRRAAVATLATDPGDQMTLIVSYTMERAVAEGAREFRMSLIPQPTLDAGVVRVRIDAPEGATIEAAADMLQIGGGSARFAGTPTEPLRLWVSW